MKDARTQENAVIWCGVDPASTSDTTALTLVVSRGGKFFYYPAQHADAKTLFAQIAPDSAESTVITK